MNALRRADVTARWWLSGTAAVAVHGMVVFALPDVPAREMRASATPVWFSLTSDGTAAQGQAATAGALDQHSKVDTAAARRSKRTRAPRTRVAAVSRSEAASPAPSSTSASTATSSTDTSASAQVTGEQAARDEGPSAPGSAAHAEGVLGALAGGLSGLGDGAAVRGPGLLPIASPCRGFFPLGAKADHGEVQIAVHVDASGRARLQRLLVETPRGQGFGSAAAACAAALRFAPALNGAGIAIAGSAKLALRFDRS